MLLGLGSFGYRFWGNFRCFFIRHPKILRAPSFRPIRSLELYRCPITGTAAYAPDGLCSVLTCPCQLSEFILLVSNDRPTSVLLEAYDPFYESAASHILVLTKSLCHIASQEFRTQIIKKWEFSLQKASPTNTPHFLPRNSTMAHLHQPLRTPGRSTPVEGSEGDKSSASSSESFVLSSFAFAPRRNYEQELVTRTLYMPPTDQITSKKLELPSLTTPDKQPTSDDETIPTFSLKRKRRGEEKDIIYASSRSFNERNEARTLFRPIVSLDEESL